jgi:hypothetical protein
VLDAEAIKAKLPDVQGIEQLAFTLVGDRLVAAFNGRTTSVAHNANEDQMILAIRNAAALPAAPEAPVVLNPQPLPTAPPPAAPKVKPMASPAPGGFAADLKAILDNAKLRVAQSQNNARAKVNDAAGRLVDVATQVDRVGDHMAQQINEQADSVLAELGQISNMPPVDGQ